MGNVLEHESARGIEDADEIEDDLKWLEVMGSMVFNDDFLEEKYADLPAYEGTEMLPDPGSGRGPGSSQDHISEKYGDFDDEDAIRRLLQLLGPQEELSSGAVGNELGSTRLGASVEDYPALLGESYLQASTHATAARMRSRLFQRMHLALLRQAYRSMSSLATEAGAKGTRLLATPPIFALPPSSRAESQAESDPAAILTSASMRMSLTLMGALRATCPGLFTSMAQTLMDIFRASAPFALAQMGSSSAYLETLAQVRTVAESTASAGAGSPEGERAQALALLLSLGVATGSVSDIVRVAKFLLERGAPGLPPSSKPFMKRLKDHSIPPKMSIPRPDTWTASFSARLEARVDVGSITDSNVSRGGAGSHGAEAEGGGCSNPATDGVHVYVWDSLGQRVHKVGTGFHGTFAGNVYCSSSRILDDIRVFKGMELAAPDEDELCEHEPIPSQLTRVSEGRNVPSSRHEGVIVSEAAANRRRALMGTGLNIGGGGAEGGEGDSNSSDDEGSSFDTANDDNETERIATAIGSSFLGLNDPPRVRALAGLFPSSSSSSSSPSSCSPSPLSSSSSSYTGALFHPLPSFSNSNAGHTSPRMPPEPVRQPQPEDPPASVPSWDFNPSQLTSNASPPLPTVTGEVVSPNFRRGNSTLSPERPIVRLHRVPTPNRPSSETQAMTRDAGISARPSSGATSTARSDSPPRTIGGILGDMTTLRTRTSDIRVGIARAVGAGTGQSVRGAGGGGSEDIGLLRFRCLNDIPLFSRVPESGFLDDGASVEGEEDLGQGDKGDILEHKVVHGFSWYRVRVITRDVSTQPVNVIGWVPLKSCDDSDWGSFDSEGKGELDGEEYIELLDPVTGNIINPYSHRASNPPVWDGIQEVATAGGGGGVESAMSRSEAVTGTANQVGGAAKSVMVRPVWLALAGGKLFLREKASGALSADEIAVLRPSDLSLESVLSLADLPIPGFATSSATSFASKPESLGEQKKAGMSVGGKAQEEEEEAKVGVVEFADTDLGATVVECSSNSEASEGILQNNLLVRDSSRRIPFPSSDDSVLPSPNDVAFLFAPTDRDRVLVVDLGRMRRVREAGIELFPTPDVVFAEAVERLTVEISTDGDTWATLGSWDRSVRGGSAAYSAQVIATAGSENTARFVRYSLAPPEGDVSPPCFLKSLIARGPGEISALEEKESAPFPAMTTDSKHIILVHTEGGRGGEDGKTDTGPKVAVTTTLGQASPSRLAILFLDPDDGYRLVKTASLAWPMDEVAVHKNALLCDGDRLVMLADQRTGVTQRTADTSVVSMRCLSGYFWPSSCDGPWKERTDQEEYMDFDVRLAGNVAPTGLAYDRRNNVMWGWDSILNKLCRWRSDGLAPVFTPPRLSPIISLPSPTGKEGEPASFVATATETQKKTVDSSLDPGPDPEPDHENRVTWIRSMLASSSPSHRVEGLENVCFSENIARLRGGGGVESIITARRDAALLLGYLDRLGEPYAPPKEPIADARVLCELEAASGGKEDGNFSRLLVRGEDWSCKEPGVNVLVLTENLGAGGEIAKGFHTQESRHAGHLLADYLHAVPHGRTVMIAVHENAGGNLTDSTKRALMSVGAGRGDIAVLGSKENVSFAMIGRKGAQSGSVPQALREAKKGCATVRQRLPATKVPLCVDVSKETFHSLVTLVLEHKLFLLPLPEPSSTDLSSIEVATTTSISLQTERHVGMAGGGTFCKSVEASELDAAIMLSAVNVLTNQIFQLLRGSTPAATLASFFPDDVAPLLAFLVDVIDQDQPAAEKSGKSQRSAGKQHPSFLSSERIASEQHPVQASSNKGSKNEEHPEEVARTSATRFSLRMLQATTPGILTTTASGEEPLHPSQLGRTNGGNAVRQVSCTIGAVLPVSANNEDIRGGERVTVPGVEAVLKGRLQMACLRLFVTGMDLFFPSCAERYCLLAKNLYKYLNEGLSPARETVLELLLRRMSDPDQLVEFVSHVPPPLKKNKARNGDDGIEANPFIVSPSVEQARGPSRMGDGTSLNEEDAAKTATAAAVAVEPAPSPIRLQSLLLAVATSDGISKIKALKPLYVKSSGDADELKFAKGGRREGGTVQGGVGAAAVEMLGRLTNQLLSSAACIIMESVLGAFDEDSEEDFETFLQAVGVPPQPIHPTAKTTLKQDSSAFAPNPAVGCESIVCTNSTVGTDEDVGGISIGGAEKAECANRRCLEKEVSAASTLVVLVTAMCRSCASLAAQAVETVDILGGDLGESNKGFLSKEADLLLQGSPLGKLLPMLASALTLLVENHGFKIQEKRLTGMAREVVGVMMWVSKLLENVPKERLSMAGSSKAVGTVKKSVVMESKHNYNPLTNEMLELHIKDASRMVVTFDDRSRTEEGYDYMVFWKDESKTESWHPQIPKLSGVGRCCNFPGFGGRPPLIIESNRTWVEWKTDGSNEDWGWKFTATANVKKMASCGGGYWLLGLDRQLAGAGAALVRCLVISKPWGGKAEDDNAPWMEDNLFAGARDMSHEANGAGEYSLKAATADAVALSSFSIGPVVSASPAAGLEGPCSDHAEKILEVKLPNMTAKGEASAVAELGATLSPELQLLLEVVNRLEGTGGNALCKTMRAKVGEDQGSVEAINRAVYATCAALLWHHGLGKEALALVKGSVSTPSKALTKAWKFGQQMRQYFNYGDVRDAVNNQMELQRQQAVGLDSSWKGLSSLSLEEPAPSRRPILSRGPSVYQGAEEKVISEVSQRIVSRSLFLLSLPSQAGRVSSQEQSKRRWSLLARLGGLDTLTRTPSQSHYTAEGADLLAKWKEVVDEATAMRKLKAILNYRRKAAEMREKAKENSVIERIMKFVQCPVDIAELEMVRQCRDQRASMRTEGLRLTRALVAAAASPPSKAWLLSSHSQSIRLTKREDRPSAHVHYLSSVEGCEPSAHLALAREFSLLVNSSLEILKECSEQREGETRTEAAERRILAISSIQALALDYDVGDHGILKESILLEVLEPLLQNFNEPGAVDDLIEDAGSKSTIDEVEQGSEDFNSKSIEDEIAALEAELDEERMLHNDDSFVGGADYISKGPSGGGEEAVRKAAWCLFEVLLPRCVGLEGQGLETKLEEPTSFSNRLLKVLVRQLGKASANVQRSSSSLGVLNTPPSDETATSPVAKALLTGAGDANGEELTKATVVDEACCLQASEDVSSFFTTSLPEETLLLKRGMRLRRDEPGRAAAHRDMGVRHSMSFWLRRDSCDMDANPGVWYTPAKVGEIVARGPRWRLGDMTDGGLNGLGTVLELMMRDMKVLVQWDITGYTGLYKMGGISEHPHHTDDASAPASVEDLLVWEVVKVDPSVGGSIIMKGRANRVTEEENSEPWSQFGVSLMGNATLVYYATAGEGHLFTVHSRTMIEPNVWTHVAVVQAKYRCYIYVDGVENGVASVPNHMFSPGGMVKRVIESQHPYAGNVDKKWDVHVEGAVSYSVTFGSKTKTEPIHDFVRFLVDTHHINGSCYGEEKYSGGWGESEANWPGLDGRPPLIINAPSFTVYFHTDQSNNDWGFEVTLAAYVSAPEVSDEHSSKNVNPFPVYLGQPPSYVSSQRSANGFLWGARTFTESLTVEQVRFLARAAPPPEPSLMEERACTDVLSLVQRCALSMGCVVSQAESLSLEAGGSPLVCPQVLGPLLIILLQGSLKLRLSAARLCEILLPQAPLEMIQAQLIRAGLADPLPLPSSIYRDATHATPLIRSLMLQIGETLSVWSRPAATAAVMEKHPEKTAFLPQGLISKESISSGEEAFALAGAHVGLLQAFLAKEGWSAPLVDCLHEACSYLAGVTKSLENAGIVESQGGRAEEVAKAACDPKLWMVHACFALLGGNFQGLHVGGKAIALLEKGDGTTLEMCTVLAMEWPRLQHLKAIEWEKIKSGTKPPGKGVEFVCPAKEWEGLQALGDAVVVCLHSEPEKPRVLPRGRLSPETAPLPANFLSALETPPFNLQSPRREGRRLSAAAEASVAAAKMEGRAGIVPYVPEGLIGTLVEAFSVLSAADASDKREKHTPLMMETTNELVLETSHPHNRGIDELYPINLPGADSIKLHFDEDCRTEKGTAFICIYKDDTQTVIWGKSMYHGRDKDANWPGLHGRPNVCIPASSCVIRFHSEDRPPDWGFRVTARAECKGFTNPPERPPLLGTSALSTLQACGSKALVSLVTSWPQFVPHAMALIKPLAKRALGEPGLQKDLKKKMAPGARKLSFESEHPYAHSADRKQKVRIEGAEKLLVTFDGRTRTEHGFDFMVFYADDSMSKVYGEAVYTGGNDGYNANWPGVGGRPPLEIPACHFIFQWKTDSIVNDWGWKMIVTPVMGKINALNLPSPVLDSKLASLLRICRDCPKEQPPAEGLAKLETELTLLPQAPLLYETSNSPAAGYLLASPTSTRRSEPESFIGQKMLYSSPALASLYASTWKQNIGLRRLDYVPGWQHWPRVFVVNSRDADEILLRAAPHMDSAKVGKALANASLVATQENGDWLRVLPIPAEVPVEQARLHLQALLNESSPPQTIHGYSSAISPTTEYRDGQEDDGFLKLAFREATKDLAAASQALSPSRISTGGEEEIKEAGVDDGGEIGAMWALRRQGDMLYLVPEEEAFSHLVSMDLRESEDSTEARALGAADGGASGTGTVAFEVLDPPPGDESGPAAQGAFGTKADDELVNDSKRLWSALAETSQAAASRFSRLALTKILAGSAKNPVGNDRMLRPLVLSDIGGAGMFLMLLRATFTEACESGSDTDTAALEVLKEQIVEFARGETVDGRKVVDKIVAFALHQLETATSLDSFLGLTKAVVKTWETSHNYADNTDTYTEISIPGAKRIHVVFDDKSSTEMGFDFVRIYKALTFDRDVRADASHKSFWGEHRYHGPASNSSKMWAGVRGQAPLMVEADKLFIYFHSDSSNNDWGARLTAYGIMQLPSVEQRAALKAKRNELGRPETEMACWLLEALAKDADGDYIKRIMYQRSTLATLTRFLQISRKEAKIWVVHLLTALLHSVCPPEVTDKPPTPKKTKDKLQKPMATSGQVDMSHFLDVMLESGGAVSILKELAKSEAKLEEGKGLTARSPLLQALVQVCIIADECGRAEYQIATQRSRTSYENGGKSPPIEPVGDPITEKGADPLFPHWPGCDIFVMAGSGRSISLKDEPCRATDSLPLLALPGFDTTAGESEGGGGRSMIRWHVKILDLSGPGPWVGVGAAGQASFDGTERKIDVAKEPSWLVTWGSGGILKMETTGPVITKVKFGSQLKAGDIVTVEVNLFRKEVVFYRNQAFVGLAIGPEGSKAWIEHGQTRSPAHVPWNDGDSLHLAAALSSLNDAVQIVLPPLPLCPTVASGVGVRSGRLLAGGGGEWLECVKGSLELLSSALNREIPASFVAKELLPKCQQRSSITQESSHPLTKEPTEDTVTIPGAASLEIIFDVLTSMGPQDKIAIFGKSDGDPERLLLGLEGGTEASSESGGSPAGGGDGDIIVSGVSVGDRVVRGPAWNWGDWQDGGAGGYGTVIGVKPWKGKPRSGIKVLWDDNKFVGLYRWDHEGCFDVLVVGHGDKSTKPIIIAGDTLSIRVESGAVSKTASDQPESDPWTCGLRLHNRAHVYVNVRTGGDSGRLFMRMSFTLEAWFRLEATSDGRLGSSTYPLISRGIMADLSQVDLIAISSQDLTQATLRISMRAGDQTVGITLEGGVLLPGRWGHVAFAIEATGIAKLIVDGAEVASGVFQGPRMILQDIDLVIGKCLESDGSFHGHVYDLRVWCLARTVAEVAAGRKALPQNRADGLLANFTFTEGSGQTANRGPCADILAVPSQGCTWDNAVESPAPPALPSLSHWGWRCVIKPIYTIKNLREMSEFKEELQAFESLYGGGDVKHDLALVRYINCFAEKKAFDAQRLLHCSWDDMTPSEEDLVREPFLRELLLWPPPTTASSDQPGTENTVGLKRGTVSSPKGGVNESKEGNVVLADDDCDVGDLEQRLENSSDINGGFGAGLGLTEGKKGGCIAARFEMLQSLNRKLRDALPYFDLGQMDRKWSAAALLSSGRGLIFRVIKEPVLISALKDTAHADGGQFDLNLSRAKAAKHIQAGHTDTEGRWTVFGQAFRQMHKMHPRALRTHNQVYNCVLMGERAQDAGGPYRESWSMYAQELQSTALPLLIRTPNGEHAAGMGRDRYVPNPGAISAGQVEMFVFLGKLMGHAIRSKEYIGLNLSGVVWKALVGQEVQREDLDSVDVLLTRSMQDIRTIHQKGVTRAIFSDIVMETFSTLSLDDREVELKLGGKNIPVTWNNRLEYADLVESQRLSECCSMVKHIRKGLSMVVPIAVLGMFCWDEVETMICGTPEVDIDLLEAVTEYSGCRREQPHVRLFWQALRDFTSEERSMLVKFTWGRTRLPLTAEGFSQRFKLQSFDRSPADNYLPVAHTCFFSLELPAYSTLEVMKERLRNAIYNCQAIDGDDTFAGMQAAAMGWDWQEEDEEET